MKLEYVKCGDYYIPNLIANKDPQVHLSRYGLLRKSYLKDHRSGIYTGLVLNGELIAHCYEVQTRAESMVDMLMEKLKDANCITEQLKRTDQMEWVRRMNSIKAQADEIVLHEVIYSI